MIALVVSEQTINITTLSKKFRDENYAAGAYDV
jgi:hypothetical protein